MEGAAAEPDAPGAVDDGFFEEGAGEEEDGEEEGAEDGERVDGIPAEEAEGGG